MTTDDILERFTGVKPAGNGKWLALCPAHNDRSPSLSIAAGRDGGYLLKCHAGCETSAVLKAANLTFADLSAARDGGSSTPRPTGRSTKRTYGPVVKAYDYHDATGNVLFQVRRTADKQFPVFTPNGNGGWKPGRNGAERVLYHLPELIRGVAAGKTIWLVEGERDVETLERLGLVATTKPEGAGSKWLPAYTDALRGAQVVILPDNDEPGRECAEREARALHGHAASVTVLTLPGLADHGDVSDWVEAGGTADQLVAMAAGCPVWEPVEIPGDTESEEAEAQLLAVWSWRELLGREIIPPEFVVDSLIPRGGVTLITGAGGVGKSFALVDTALSVATGSPVFGHFGTKPGPVLMLDLENDEQLLTRRVQRITRGRMGICDSGLEIPAYLVRKNDLGFAEFHVDDAKCWQALTRTIEEYGPLLLTIDPLVAIHRGDENDAPAMRAVIGSLQQLARTYNLAVVLIHHPRKRGMINDASEMIRGSSDLRAAVDSALFLRSAGDGRILVEPDKLRQAQPLPKFAVELTDTEDDAATVIRYCGGVSEALEKAAAARELVLTALEDGNKRRRELENLAEAQSIGRSTLNRVLEELTDREKLVEKPERGVYGLRVVRLQFADSEGLVP